MPEFAAMLPRNRHLYAFPIWRTLAAIFAPVALVVILGSLCSSSPAPTPIPLRQVAAPAVESAPEVTPIRIANWLSSDLFGLLNQAGIDFQDNAVPPVDLARLVEMVETSEVNATSAKTILAEMVSSGKPPDDIVLTLGLSMIQDPEVIESIVRRVLAAHPRQVADYLDGNTGIFQWLFGQVMKEAEGRANPSDVRSALSAALE